MKKVVYYKSVIVIASPAFLDFAKRTGRGDLLNFHYEIEKIASVGLGDLAMTWYK